LPAQVIVVVHAASGGETACRQISSADNAQKVFTMSWAFSELLLFTMCWTLTIKRYRRRRIAEVHHHVVLGKPEEHRQALGAQDCSGRIQTAFIERLNLTIRRSTAGLARRSWSAAHSLSELAL